MEKIIWDKSFETGFDTVDYQHKVLLDKINEIIEAINSNKPQDTLFGIFIFLEEYSFYHFMTEESFFKSFDYKESKEHIAEHNFFKEKIKSFKIAYEKKIEKIDEELLEFLLTWLLNHIKGTDKRFTDGLLKNIKLRQRKS